MKFYFSPKTTIICCVLALGMLRLAYWQWTRHLEKKEYIKVLEQRYQSDPLHIAEDIEGVVSAPSNFVHRRVTISGTFDFDKEVYLKNQRFEGVPGVHVLTPLKIKQSSRRILVNRGFVPLPLHQAGKTFTSEPKQQFLGLLKEGKQEKLFAPKDPATGLDKPWVSEWLRVNIDKIEAQLPYKLLPLYLEIVPKGADEKSIVTNSSGKEELLFLPTRSHTSSKTITADFPIPVFSTVVPPGRHFGYVFEWSFMALATLLIGLGLQMRKPRRFREPNASDATLNP